MARRTILAQDRDADEQGGRRAEALGANSGLARIDQALSLAHQRESRCDLALLHRVRGDILVRCDPTETTLAEEAYRTAIAIAKDQCARSHQLLGSLALAKLYRSTARPAEERAVLAPALEGVAPTPEMPEIAEAQAVLATVA